MMSNETVQWTASDEFGKRSFFALYDALGEVVDVGSVEDVEIGADVDAELLEYVPRDEGATGSRVGIDKTERVYVLGDAQDVLAEVKAGGYCGHNEAHSDDESWTGEMIGETLLRVDIEAVRYVLIVRKGYKVRDHYSVGGYKVTLHPAAPSVLAEWLAAKQSGSVCPEV